LKSFEIEQRSFVFDGLLTRQGWMKPAFVQVNELGNITLLSSQKPKYFPEKNSAENPPDEIHGYAIPGMPNAHSHAFQYAMAGTAEHINPSDPHQDFWSWRTQMYRIANRIRPEDLESIAAAVYGEMLKSGYTSVVEFHYLQRQTGGIPYDQPTQMSEAIIRGAKTAGIGLTLVPVFYQLGGFGENPSNEQKRFIFDSVDEYFNLISDLEKILKEFPNFRLGTGVHSLRSARPEDVVTVFSQSPADFPRHIHIAEQIKEVEWAIQTLGKRPMEWFFDHVLDQNNCNPLQCNLIHATHLKTHEIRLAAKSNLNVVLCPSTEANLGDGIFPLMEFHKMGGNWCIGSDSHIGLNPLEEIRWLDYEQRLIARKRMTLEDPNGSSSGGSGSGRSGSGRPDSGGPGSGRKGSGGLDSGSPGSGRPPENRMAEIAFRQCFLNGRSALGEQAEDYFEKGKPLDALVIDANSSLLRQTSSENLLSSILYSLPTTSWLGTLKSGEWVVRNHQHINGSKIESDFQKSIKYLKIR